MKTSPYLKLERRIASDERGGILQRWRFGRQLLDAKTGRKQLPHGLIDAVIKAAERAGLKLSEREIQYRLKCAEAYETEAEVRTACADLGSWSDLREAGFPSVESYGPDEIDSAGLGTAPDEWEQMQFEIPGLRSAISVRGRQVPLVKGEEGATVADVAAYLEMCEQKHESFGKTVDRIRESLSTMREGADGDDATNAVEAWEAATDDATEEPDAGELDA